MRRDKWLTLRVTADERREIRHSARKNPTDYILWAIRTAEAARRWIATQHPDDLAALREIASSRPGRL